MLYKVGDKVTIRKDLADYDQDGNELEYFDVSDRYIIERFGTDCTGEMVCHAGEVAVITSVHQDYYRIDLDDGKWSWLDTMFAETLTNNKYLAKCKKLGVDPKRGVMNERL